MNTSLFASRKLPVVVAVVIAALGSSAHADLITQNLVFETSSAGNRIGGTIDLRDEDLLSLNQFDPMLGTLNSVIFSITYQANFSATAVFKNSGPFAEVKGEQIVVASVRLIMPELFQELNSFGDSDRCQVRTLAGGRCSTSLSRFGFTIDPLSYSLSGAALSSYIGVGVISGSVLQRGTLNTNATKGQIDSMGWSTEWAGGMGVTYDFTPTVSVPEPGTLALFGLGLAGMGLVRRRKRAV